ncbi:MAG: hypothetical protein WCG28_03325 [bacterium]
MQNQKGFSSLVNMIVIAGILLVVVVTVVVISNIVKNTTSSQIQDIKIPVTESQNKNNNNGSVLKPIVSNGNLDNNGMGNQVFNDDKFICKIKFPIKLQGKVEVQEGGVWHFEETDKFILYTSFFNSKDDKGSLYLDTSELEIYNKSNGDQNTYVFTQNKYVSKPCSHDVYKNLKAPTGGAATAPAWQPVFGEKGEIGAFDSNAPKWIGESISSYYSYLWGRGYQKGFSDTNIDTKTCLHNQDVGETLNNFSESVFDMSNLCTGAKFQAQ